MTKLVHVLNLADLLDRLEGESPTRIRRLKLKSGPSQDTSDWGDVDLSIFVNLQDVGNSGFPLKTVLALEESAEGWLLYFLSSFEKVEWCADDTLEPPKIYVDEEIAPLPSWILE